MFMDEMKIELKDGYNVFKEIFYRKGQGNILTWKGMRNPIIAILFFLLPAIISYLVALKYPDTNWNCFSNYVFIMYFRRIGIFIV